MSDQPFEHLTPLHELVAWKPEGSAIDKQFTDYKKTNHPDQLHPLIKSLQPTIDHALNAYAPDASPIVKDRARLLAVKAVKGYSPTHGANLQTHVYRQLQELQRIGPKLNDPLPMPERLRRERGMLLKTIDSARNELGREPSDEEVSERIGLPPAKITKIRGLMRSGVPSSVLEELGDEDEEAPDMVAHQRAPEEDWLDAVYHDLTEPDRLILQHRTGYRGAPVFPSGKIAQMLGISPAAVSQRAARIQARLDEFHDG